MTISEILPQGVKRALRPVRNGLRNLLLPYFAKGHAAIVVASIGRVGSTMLFDAIVLGQSRLIFGSAASIFAPFIKSHMPDLKGFKGGAGGAYKTHCFPYDLASSSDLKVVFVYGRPSDVVLAVLVAHQRGYSRWVTNHFAHMHACGTIDQILDQDVLRLEEQIDAWSAYEGVPLLGIRYETMWDHVDALSDFVGFPLELPTRRTRRFERMDAKMVDRARRTYSQVDQKVQNLPDLFVKRGHVKPSSG